MNHQRRKSLDECSDESEIFESQFEQCIAEGGDEAARARIIAEITDWMEDCAKQGRFIPPASAERRAFRSLLDRWRFRLRQEGVYLDGVPSLADFDPSAGIVLTGECPYPGLDPYTQNLRGSFFGREGLVSSCLTHLEQQGNRILLIIGASGSGKSSVALAGVLPRLKEVYEAAWLFGPRVTPGVHPLAELAAAVAQAMGSPHEAANIQQRLANQPSEAFGQLAALCYDKPLMLFIDQFEELLTMCRDAGEQRAFSQILCALSDPATSSSGFSCRSLLTMRTDHLARFEANTDLKPLHMRLVGENNERHLSAVGFADIKRAIKVPADNVGLRFFPAAIIDQLASQTAGLSNGLPLLQFALRRLWDNRPRTESGEPLDLITEEMVNDLPDVERALGTVADAVFRKLSSTQQQICERLLLELLVLDESFEEPLRRRRSEAELTHVLQTRSPATADVGKVINEFVTAGLLRRFGEKPNSQLEVAHEALLRQWDHIYRLVTGAEVKERLHLIKQIGREAGDWAGHDNSSGYLSLRGERLARAISYAAGGWLAEAEAAAYVEACRRKDAEERLNEQRAKEEKERADAAERARDRANLRAERFRRYIWQLAGGAVLVLAVFLGWNWYSASEESFVQELVMAAREELNRNPQRSLLFSIEAARHSQTFDGGLPPTVESTLRSAIRVSRVAGLIKSYGKASINAAAYTPDGSALALGDSLGGVTFWDVAAGLQRKAGFVHVDEVEAIAFSPDGQKMASGSRDGRVVIWDARSLTPLHVLSDHVARVTSLAFSRPDGRLLATASDDASVRLWNVSSGTSIQRTLYGHSGGVRALGFGRDERQLVTAGADDRVVVWDTLQGRVLYSIDVPRRASLSDVDLSADGSLLAIATSNTVEIWDTASRSRRSILDGHTNAVFHVRFSRDQRQVATASYDGTVRVWKLPQGDGGPQRDATELARFRPEPARGLTMFTALAFGPTGETVAAASSDGTATIWSVTGDGELLTLIGHNTRIEAVAFSPSGRTVAAAGGNNGQVLTWDLSGSRKDVGFKAIQRPAKALAFSRTGAFAVGSADDVLFALPDSTEQKRFTYHTDVINDLAFSPDGSRLVSGSHDKTAIVWEVNSGKPLRVFEGHSHHVLAVAYSPDGKTIATGSRDKTIRLWHAETWELKRTLEGHVLGVLDLAFTSDGKELVSGSLDKTARVWDVGTGEQKAVFRDHTDVVNAVAIHGDRLATGADDGIRLWNLRSLIPVAGFPAGSHGAQSLAFSPDGRYLVGGALDGVVRVYAMEGEELLQLASKRVHRSWTDEECDQFLQLKRFLRVKRCPETSHSILEKAHRSFENHDFEAGKRLLRQAKGGEGASTETIDSEVDVRIGVALLKAASMAMANPKESEHAAKSQTPQELAIKFLVGAKNRSNDLTFDPESRWRELNAYTDVRRARELARADKLAESVAAFEQARNAGWGIPGDTQRVASQLFAVEVLSKTWDSLRSRSTKREDFPNMTEQMENALKVFPDIGPGHRVLARLYAMQNDFASAEKHYVKAASKEASGEPLASLAELSFSEHLRRKEVGHAKNAAKYARAALDRDSGLDRAWFFLGLAEHALTNQKKAVEALDQVSPSSELFADALNLAAAIYFEDLADDQAAYQRLTRAVQLAPDNLSVRSNYAEFLLSAGRLDQAKAAAAPLREHPQAQLPGSAYIRAVMSFVLFSAELLSGNRNKALAELDEIDRHVKAAAVEAQAAVEKGEDAEKWQYKGIRRSLERRLGTGSNEQRSSFLSVLKFVETDGKEGALDNMRQLLRSEAGRNR